MPSESRLHLVRLVRVLLPIGCVGFRRGGCLVFFPPVVFQIYQDDFLSFSLRRLNLLIPPPLLLLRVRRRKSTRRQDEFGRRLTTNFLKKKKGKKKVSCSNTFFFSPPTNDCVCLLWNNQFNFCFCLIREKKCQRCEGGTWVCIQTWHFIERHTSSK